MKRGNSFDDADLDNLDSEVDTTDSKVNPYNEDEA